MKKLIVILVFFSSSLFAQVTLDSSTSGTPVQGTTYTLSGVAIGDHPNRLLLLGFGDNFGTNTTDVTDCTFDPTPGSNQAMTKLVAINDTVSVNSVYLWYLKQPTVTTANVVCHSTNSNRAVMGSISLYNVNQSTPFRDSDSKTDSGATTSSGNLTLTTVSGDYGVSVIFVGSGNSAPTDLVPGGSATQKWDSQVNGDTYFRGGGSVFIATGTSTDFSWTWTNNDHYTFVGAAVQSATAITLFRYYYDLLRN